MVSLLDLMLRPSHVVRPDVHHDQVGRKQTEVPARIGIVPVDPIVGGVEARDRGAALRDVVVLGVEHPRRNPGVGVVAADQLIATLIVLALEREAREVRIPIEDDLARRAGGGRRE